MWSVEITDKQLADGDLFVTLRTRLAQWEAWLAVQAAAGLSR